MQKNLLYLYGVTLLVSINHAGKHSYSLHKETYAQDNSNLQEEKLIIEIWKQKFQDLTLIEELQKQILDLQIQAYNIQKQITTDQKQNRYTSHSQQEPEELVKIFEDKIQTFESRLNQYMCYESTINTLKEKIDTDQKQVNNMLDETIKFIYDRSTDCLIAEEIYNLAEEFKIKLKSIHNNNNHINLNNKLLSSIRYTL